MAARRRAPDPLKAYFATLIQTHGRRLLYWDTGAILKCFEPGEGRFADLLTQNAGDRLVTSTFVVAETVRRIVKSSAPRHKFRGPRGEQGVDLVRSLLRNWLAEKSIEVLHPDQIVFAAAKEMFVTRHHALGCDLSDTLSYVMVKGLEQPRIVSPDGHFRAMGLLCLPG